MNPTAVALTIMVVAVVIAVIAWLIYKAGFKPKEITVKTGLVEAKMERETGSDAKPETPRPRTEATQEALEKGRIKDSKIKAPAESGAKLKQKAEGEGSSIAGSDIELS
jgi:hypothetical protein